MYGRGKNFKLFFKESSSKQDEEMKISFLKEIPLNTYLCNARWGLSG
jgi:hypothetical protein